MEVVIYLAGLLSGIVMTVIMVRVMADDKVAEILEGDLEGEIIKTNSITPPEIPYVLEHIGYPTNFPIIRQVEESEDEYLFQSFL